MSEAGRDRLRVTTGAPWEDLVAYRRAVRVGDQVFVAGTVAVDDAGQPFAPGDAGAQTSRCLEIIAQALEKAGSHISHVVRTRLFVIDMSLETQRAVGQAHRKVFADFPPACSMIGVAALAGPDFIIEIEADAVIPPGA
ncbi:Endoribonuclease L-PSP [Oceanicaulis sp. HTCC2633]|uniref:RidA family protein n=1 Tax=Oceanicaulis sp. HTCC2633 TaxID=314254 RepID=UPI000066D487|nr:RidA family protein [Oceanicaulis sp. HTCC2633]EAP91285.1 Endoribonuclease L-PSP [Oceanicaulis sp. HTCC2633]